MVHSRSFMAKPSQLDKQSMEIGDELIAMKKTRDRSSQFGGLTLWDGLGK